MVVNADKKDRSLRWIPTENQTMTAQLHLESGEDHLPANSCVFSKVTAETAAALSMSTENERVLRDDLAALGYGDIVTVGYPRADRDKIGMTVASRTKDDILQIAAVLRGTTGDEWYSNFEVGYAAEHSGFAKAADFAELAIGDYVFTRAIGTEPAFFVTGYSRGGAVANILAKRLCDRYGLDRVCAYTFASPAVTLSRLTNRYRCIFNLVREEDFFTRVPLAAWGYTRYGQDIVLPEPADIGERFRELTGEAYIGFRHKEETDSFLCAMASLAPNVHAYYRRQRQVGGRRLSLYGFLHSVADMLSGHMDEETADVLVSAMISDYADLVSFLSSGAELEELIASACAIPRCSVADSHSPAAYMAALERFLKQ